jgi:hypothetical protein
MQSSLFTWLLDCFHCRPSGYGGHVASLAMTRRIFGIASEQKQSQPFLFFPETARYYHHGFPAT